MILLINAVIVCLGVMIGIAGAILGSINKQELGAKIGYVGIAITIIAMITLIINAFIIQYCLNIEEKTSFIQFLIGPFTK